MVRHWSQRGVTLFFALWLSLVGLEGSLLPCPMHQMAERASAQGAAEGAAGGHSASSHRQHGEPGSHQNHRCSCPGSCSGSPVGLPTSFSIKLVEQFRESGPLRQSSQGHTAIRLDFLLPFSTAPPAISLT